MYERAENLNTLYLIRTASTGKFLVSGDGSVVAYTKKERAVTRAIVEAVLTGLSQECFDVVTVPTGASTNPQDVNTRKKKFGAPVKADRVKYDEEKLSADFSSGKSYAAIAAEYGVSAERIRQVLLGLGLARNRATIRRREAVDAAAARLKKNLLSIRAEFWGFPDIESLEAHVSVHGCTTNKESPMSKYIMQRKNNIRNTGQEWNMTFAEWWNVWEESGKWQERGRGKYAMRTIVASRPFEVGNVEIYHIRGSAKRGLDV